MGEQEALATPSRATEETSGGSPFPPRERGRRAKPPWHLNWVSVVVALIAVAGLLVIMYPSTAAWWSQYHESKAIVAYTAQIKEDPPPGNTVQLGLAREYNKLLSSGEIVVGADSNKPVLLGEAEDESGYWDLLPSSTGVMARLKIPSIDVDLPIYHGTSDAVLEKGVGHLQGTSLPVGGENTHSVLTAHTGLATATLFNDLKKVQVGDTFTVSVFGEVLTYQAAELQTILPDQTGSLIIQQDKDLVTLVTCTPLGINTHRYLVTGKRVFPTPEKDIQAALSAPEVPHFPWWAVIIPAGLVLAGIYVWRSGYPPVPKRTAAKLPPEPAPDEA